MNKPFIIAACAAMMCLSVNARLKKAPAVKTAPESKQEVTNEKIDTTKLYDLQELQVVSTRATKTTPVAYTNISKSMIQSLNYGKDLPEILQLTPSVTTTSDAGNGIGYTSMRVRGTDPSRINVTVNGIPLNDAESSTVFWVNFNDIISSAQSVQIQRGVGTSTSGSGAFGATVNILTEPVGAKPFVGIDGSFGSYMSHKETIRFGTGLINDHWGVQGRVSNIGSDGYLDRASTSLNSYFLQAGYFGDKTVVKFITFNGYERTYHAWNYTSKYEQSLYGRTYNSCGEYYDEYGNTYYYDGQTDNYNSNNFQLIWNQKFNNKLNFNLALHYTHGNGYYEEYKVGADLYTYGFTKEIDKAYSDLIRQQKMLNNFWGFVSSLNYDNHKGFTMNYGLSYNSYDGDNYGKVIAMQTTEYKLPDNYEYYRNNAIKNEFTVYGRASYEFFKGFSAYADLQYRNVYYKLQDPVKSYYNAAGAQRNWNGVYLMKNTFNFFNPKAGINYDINKNHRVYISYGISHKEPVRNNYQNYWAVEEHNYWKIDDTKYDSEYPHEERLNDLELGYKYQSPRFSAGLNFYWMDYKDQLTLTGDIDEIGEAITRNLSKSYRLGIEIEAGWKVCDWFRWDLNGTWSRNRVKDITVKAEDENGNKVICSLDGETPLSFSPDWILNNIFTFTYKGFKGSIQSNWTSKQYMVNTGYMGYLDITDGEVVSMMLDGHFTTNIDVDYTFTFKKLWLKNLTVGATFYNITNAYYDNNGWAAPSYKLVDGALIAYSDNKYMAGFAPSAPFNVMGHVSINF